jgi:hypothetical protein
MRPVVRGALRLGPQQLANHIREAKCTHLGYRPRLSRLRTLDPPSAQVPLASPSMTGLRKRSQEKSREKEIDHMGVK